MDSIIKPWYKRAWGISIIIFFTFIIGLILAVGVFFVQLMTRAQNPDAAVLSGFGYSDEAERVLIEGEDAYWTGNADAPLVIVEFGDFACSQCKNSYSTIRGLSARYKDRIKHIYRDFPVVSDYSPDLALAARCAGEQGLFWPMHDKLFQNQGISTEKQVAELANQIGADTPRFTNCINDGTYLPQIKKDIADAQELGVEGTPTWFINGSQISGDIPLDVWEEIINRY